MLGHADIKQTQRYLNISNEEPRKSLTGVWERRRQLRLAGQLSRPEAEGTRRATRSLRRGSGSPEHRHSASLPDQTIAGASACSALDSLARPLPRQTVTACHTTAVLYAARANRHSTFSNVTTGLSFRPSPFSSRTKP
jgi:hypothetical protein